MCVIIGSSNSKGDGSMKFIISGKNITVTEGLKTAVQDKLSKLERYFTPDTEVVVTLSVEKERQKIEKQYHSYSVYDSFAAYQNQKQADIVWFDQKIPYDLAFWIHTDSLEPKYEKGAVVLIKQTYYDQAGHIYAIDFDGQTLIKRVFREANGIRLVSLNKKYSDQIIPLDEEPGVIGKVIDGFVPLDLEEIK